MDDRQKESLSALAGQLKRLMSNWPIDEGRASVMKREMASIWNRVGEHRFTQGVTNIIQNSKLQFFPSVGEFMGYVPEVRVSWLEQHEEICRQLRPIRNAKPDEFFGEADVVALMRVAQERAAKNLPALPADEMIQEVLSIRHACQQKNEVGRNTFKAQAGR